MENLNFLSIKFQQTELKLKIKKYKVFVCMFWIISLSLFISQIYFNHLNKELENVIKIDNAKGVNKQQDNVIKKLSAINNFIDFYNGTNNNKVFNEITINDTQLLLNAIITDKNEFYSIVYNIEHSNKYNIVYLSPLNDYNGKYSFKLTLEVRK